MSGTFSSILKKSDPFCNDIYEHEVREFVTKFNQHHDELGRFTTSDKAVVTSRGASDSWSGGANVSRGSRYGATTESARSAMVGGKGRKRMGGVVKDYQSALSNKKRHNSSVAVYSRADESGNKVHQSVYMTTHEASGKRDALDRSTKDLPSEAKAADLMAGQEGGHSVTHFESHSVGSAKDQNAKHVRLTYNTKEFKSLSDIQNALAQAGLSRTLVSKSGNGWEVHAPIGNGTKAGRAIQSKLVQFRRMHVPVKAEHFNGSKTVTNVKDGLRQINNFVKAHPDHPLSKKWSERHPETVTA